MELEFDSSGNVLPISNEDLSIKNIPSDGSSFGDCFQFAHTFDGYAAFGDDAFRVRDECDLDGDDLSSLRNFLFIQARGHRHGGGPDPGDGEWESEKRAIRSIRRLLMPQSEQVVNNVGSSVPNHVRLTLQQLLEQSGVPVEDALVMRHTPPGELGIAYPSLAAKNLAEFNAYQSIQGPAYQKRLQQKSWLVSFVVNAIGQTVLAGVFFKKSEIAEPERVCIANRLLSKYGYKHGSLDDPIWFDLHLTEHLAKYRGRLVVDWHNPIAWCRDASSSKSIFEITSLSVESLLVPPQLPDWRTIVWTWDRLKTLPQSWRIAIAQWRAIYLIHDTSTRKNYIGSAYGVDNLLSRWEGYAKTGDNDNKYLKPLDPKNLQFSILEVMSQTALPEEVTRRESTWKKRLHTLHPAGLNGNA